jgi:proline iminopeptidase
VEDRKSYDVTPDGIFLLRRRELEWFYQRGASAIFPDAWEQYLAPIPPGERDDLLAAYHRRLTGADSAVAMEAARAWSVWEGATSYLKPDPEHVRHSGEDAFALALARIESHYFAHRGFFAREDALLEGVERMRAVPAVIVQGRYDVVCPMETAWELYRRWPEAEFVVVPDAGHSGFEEGIAAALVAATDRFASEL